MKRKGSLNHQFVQRIPADVKARAAGIKLHIPVGPETIITRVSPKADAVRVSLRTSDPGAVKERQAQVVTYLESLWRSLRTGQPQSLTPRQSAALAGEFYAEEAREATLRRIGFDGTRNPETGVWSWPEPLEPGLAPPDHEELAGAASQLANEGIDAEKTVGAYVDRFLREKGYGAVDPDSRQMLLRDFLAAERKAVAEHQKRLAGDFSTDLNPSAYPAWSPSVAPTPAASTNAVSLMGLVEGWWVEAKAGGRTVSTYESYRHAARRLVDFLGHDDATAVTPANIVAFKEHRLAQGIKPGTVGDNDLTGLRSVFGWAAANFKVASNPAVGITVTRAKRIKLRGRGFTPAEATAILTHSLRNHSAGRQRPKLQAARRWVPWLCAYTGARVGEMAQLRKEDVRRHGDLWVVTITPEAGTVKDKELRLVVLHAHLIEQGFNDFVTAAAPGYLFLTPKADGSVRGPWRTVKNRLVDFAREMVKDPNVPPNHGWRHAFKTVGREAGIADSVLDGICGHASKTEGGKYGEVTPKTQKDAMKRFPKFAVKGA